MSVITEYLQDAKPFLSQWYVILPAALVIFLLGHWIQVFRFKSRHGCAQSARFLDGGFLTIPALLNVLKAKQEGGLIDFARNLFIKYGHTFHVLLVGIPIQFTIDPENIKAVLATQFNDFSLGTRHAHFKPLLGDGIFTLDAEGWKNSRAMLRPQFAREQVAHVRSLEPHLQTFAKHVEKSKGETIDLQKLFFRLTVDTATEFLFGESVYSLSDELINEAAPLNFDGRADFAEAFNTAQSYLATRSWLQQFYFIIRNREFSSSTARVHKFTSYYVNQALNTDPEELEKKSKGGYVFLYELVKQTRDPKILQDQLLNILLAGRDTTAGLLSFTFYELARRPEIFEKLKKEIYEAFGSGDDVRVEDITFESLKKCEYLKFVLNEALRLYPSVPINFRVTTRQTTLPRGGGPDGTQPVYLGKGTTVAYSVYATHRLKEYYGEDAEEFRPERWADLKRVGWAYVPFNGGPRICLGQQFALTEGAYVITRLIQMFPNLSSRDEGTYPPPKAVQLTMCLQDGCYVSLSK